MAKLLANVASHELGGHSSLGVNANEFGRIENVVNECLGQKGTNCPRVENNPA